MEDTSAAFTRVPFFLFFFHVPKGKIMRALRRYFLGPLIMAAALFSAVAPANSFASASAHSSPSRFAQGCPQGTHWDDITHTCV